jgi:hypothetical protein
LEDKYKVLQKNDDNYTDPCKLDLFLGKELSTISLFEDIEPTRFLGNISGCEGENSLTLSPLCLFNSSQLEQNPITVSLKNTSLLYSPFYDEILCKNSPPAILYIPFECKCKKIFHHNKNIDFFLEPLKYNIIS